MAAAFLYKASTKIQNCMIWVKIKNYFDSKTVNNFLSIIFNFCVLKNPSPLDGSLEYPQQMLRKKKKIWIMHSYLEAWSLVYKLVHAQLNGAFE